MALVDLTDWLDQFTGPDFIWYIKRLSGNDTLANGSHQAGPYVPKAFLFEVLPELDRPHELDNPKERFWLNIDSHPDRRRITATWYNNRLRGGTRNETRLTNFGGEQSPLLNPDSTGALAVFVFRYNRPEGVEQECNVWICDNPLQEDAVEDRVGPVEPGKARGWSPVQAVDAQLLVEEPVRTTCALLPDEIPPEWLERFPSGIAIIQKAIELKNPQGLDPDTRLMQRRKCEYEVFLSVEKAIEMPWIQQGFTSIDEFISRAQTILQRRKARSGRSLELHTRQIFIEENLQENVNFSHQPESEPGKKPDFLFPSRQAYQTAAFPNDHLRMLAVKTTCKDRWRQILNEADRIPVKHLLTLQEGVSENQFREMTDANVRLVVPQRLISTFPASVQGHLQTLESFIGDVRLLRTL